MRVRELIEQLNEMDPDATVLTPRDGFSLEVELIEQVQEFCLMSPGRWQRCWATECDREKTKGVLML